MRGELSQHRGRSTRSRTSPVRPSRSTRPSRRGAGALAATAATVACSSVDEVDRSPVEEQLERSVRAYGQPFSSTPDQLTLENPTKRADVSCVACLLAQ
jgi:hypothetical protein